MTTRIALNRIAPDLDQPRKIFDKAQLDELANSIAENGLIQPITVRASGNGKRGYTIIAGERRWRAHKILEARGLRAFVSIEAHVRKGAAGAGVRIKQIVENLQRADIEPMEEARAFAAAIEEFGLTPAELAKRIGVAQFRVDWRLSLLNLAAPIARMLEARQIDQQIANEAARLPTQAEQLRLIRMVNRAELVGWKSVRNAVDAMLAGTTAADLFGPVSKPSADDVRLLNSMERRIEQVKGMVARGWRAGECIIANKVDPDRAGKMADEMAAIGSALRVMERELRNVGAQAKIAMAS